MTPLPAWVAAPKHPVSHWDCAVTQQLEMRMIPLILCCATGVEEIVKPAWGLGMSPFLFLSSLALLKCKAQKTGRREMKALLQ